MYQMFCHAIFQNVSFDGVTEQLNGNEKSNLDSLGFGFSVGEETDKVKDNSHIEDFERIQKDTTDFCNIQVCSLLYYNITKHVRHDKWLIRCTIYFRYINSILYCLVCFFYNIIHIIAVVLKKN